MRRAPRCLPGIVATVLTLSAAGTAFGETFGWRGDGTGRFPNANPPVTWKSVSPVMNGLHFSAKKPVGDAPAGTPANTGVVAEWLIVGPLAGDDTLKDPLDKTYAPDEKLNDYDPDVGKMLGNVKWQSHSSGTGLVDFAAVFGEDAQGIAYAHTYVHAAVDGKVTFRVKGHGKLRVWVNGGRIVPDRKTRGVTLRKGWNRLLVKTNWAEKTGKYHIYPSLWHVGVHVSGTPPFAPVRRNIAWVTKLPAPSIASPVIAGDRVFVTSEPYDLFCVRKSDGRVLWVRSLTFFHALSDAQKKEPAFTAIVPLAAKVDALNALFATEKGPGPEQLKERADLLKKIQKDMKKIDAKRYVEPRDKHGLVTCTPVTDGTHVYVWTGYGIGACYDLQGGRKWGVIDQHPQKHHGHNSSPVLVDGKLICHMRELVAFDADTGKLAWRMDINRTDHIYQEHFHTTPVTFQIEGRDYLYAFGQIVRVSDGKRMWEDHGWKANATIPSAVIDGGKLYDLVYGRVRVGELPTSTEKIALTARGKRVQLGGSLDVYRRVGFAASPLCHDGLLYVVDYMGRLYVYDVKTHSIVYTHDLGFGMEVRTFVYPLGTCYVSPTLIGGNIVFLGTTGTAVVIKPGRTYQEIARNRIEHITWIGHWREKPEGFVASPVADGNRLYVRGSENLYCIGR